jgi:hypothetical protein
MLSRRLLLAVGVGSFTSPPEEEVEVFHGVRAFNDATQTLTNGAYTIVALNAEEYDTDGFHDNSTNNSRLTVPLGLAGYYHVFGAVSIESGSNQRTLIVCKNATDIEGGTDFGDILVPAGENAGAGQVHFTFNTVRPLEVGDFIEMAVFQNSGGALDLDIGSEAGDYVPSLGMHYLGAL